MSHSTAPPLPDFIERLLPAAISRHRVPVEVDRHTYNLHVMRRGHGRPVLLLHGNPTWSFLYRRVFAALDETAGQSEGLELIAPDLLGLGLSDHPTDVAIHTIDHHAAAIRGLVQALDLRDVVLVIQDWGGPIGLRAFADMPERLAGLVVLNTVVGPPRPGFRPTAFHRFARLPVVSDVVFKHLGFPQRALWIAQGDWSSIRGDVSRAYAWPLRSNPIAPLALARMVPDSLDHPSVAALARAEALITSVIAPERRPTAIVWGDRDPVLGRVIKRVETLLPHADVTRTQAGHFLQEEVPETIAAAIRRVVAQLPRWSGLRPAA